MNLNFAGRQYPLHVYERLPFAEFNRANDGDAGYLIIPPKTELTADLEVDVTVSYVGPTTAELIVTNMATLAVVATVDLTAAPAVTTLQAAGYLADGLRLKVEVNKAGAVATAGHANITGAYLNDGRADEQVPESTYS
jgi:hypothetical protein